MELPPTPELNRMQEAREKGSEVIGEFLEWAQHEKGLLLAHWEGIELVADYYSIEKLLAEFFGIDLQKVDQERKQILDSLNKENIVG